MYVSILCMYRFYVCIDSMYVLILCMYITNLCYCFAMGQDKAQQSINQSVNQSIYACLVDDVKLHKPLHLYLDGIL